VRERVFETSREEIRRVCVREKLYVSEREESDEITRIRYSECV
jgi:hypothetical protein